MGFLSASYTDENGNRWLKQNGMLDYAGSAVVHTVGGFAGLIGAVALGPRKSFESGEGRKSPNELLCALGVSILWMGWYGFNCGSTLGAGANGGASIALASKIAVVTTISASSATVTSILVSYIQFDHYSLAYCLNNVLAGLVAITAPCAVVEPWAAMCIGIIACGIYSGGNRIDHKHANRKTAFLKLLFIYLTLCVYVMCAYECVCQCTYVSICVGMCGVRVGMCVETHYVGCIRNVLEFTRKKDR